MRRGCLVINIANARLAFAIEDNGTLYAKVSWKTNHSYIFNKTRYSISAVINYKFTER